MTVRFGKHEQVTFGEVRERDATDQAQVLTTLEMRNGSSFSTMDEAAAVLASEFDADESLELDRYEITRDGVPTNVLWLYFAEHGIVFDLRTGWATPIHCVQQHFWSTDDEDADAVALAEALDELDF
jgi:hypothetical protein